MSSVKNYSNMVFVTCSNCDWITYIICNRCRAANKFEIVDKNLNCLELDNEVTSELTDGAECHCGNIIRYINCSCNRKLSASLFHLNKIEHVALVKQGESIDYVESELEKRHKEEDKNESRFGKVFVVCFLSLAYYKLDPLIFPGYFAIIALWVGIFTGIYVCYSVLKTMWKG